MAVNDDGPLVLTRDEIVDMIESDARARRGISARTLLRSLSVAGPSVKAGRRSTRNPRVLLLCCWLEVANRAEGQAGAPAAQRGRTSLTPARVVAGSGNKAELASRHGITFADVVG